MIKIERTADAHSLDIIKDDKKVAMLQWHDEREPRIVFTEEFGSLTIAETREVIARYEEETGAVIKKRLVPSMFLKDPMESVFQNSEHETVARNIMVILAKTGDTFRPISYEEYEYQRKTSGKNYGENERKYFDEVVKYCISANTVPLFSKVWAEIWNREVREATALA